MTYRRGRQPKRNPRDAVALDRRLSRGSEAFRRSRRAKRRCPRRQSLPERRAGVMSRGVNDLFATTAGPPELHDPRARVPGFERTLGRRAVFARAVVSQLSSGPSSESVAPARTDAGTRDPWRQDSPLQSRSDRYARGHPVQVVPWRPIQIAHFSFHEASSFLEKGYRKSTSHHALLVRRRRDRPCARCASATSAPPVPPHFVVLRLSVDSTFHLLVSPGLRRSSSVRRPVKPPRRGRGGVTNSPRRWP